MARCRISSLRAAKVSRSKNGDNVSGDGAADALYHTFRYDRATQSGKNPTRGSQPAAIVATVLLQHGHGWRRLVLAERYCTRAGEPPHHALHPVTNLQAFRAQAARTH
jgi:hypothetical protein